MKSLQSHPSAALLGVANKPPLTWELPQPKRPIALEMRGDYLADPMALRQMAFVMKGGRVFKYQP